MLLCGWMMLAGASSVFGQVETVPERPADHSAVLLAGAEDSTQVDLLAGAEDSTQVDLLAGAEDSTQVDSLGPVPLHMNDLVQQSMQFLLSNPERHLNHWRERARTFLPMIETIFREEGVPDEMKYLAFVESGLNPRARSWARASGMWQFIAATGGHYGLSANGWVDERNDPEKATRAAARHLRDLYQDFGDWHLALAGYNFSPGKLRRYIREFEQANGRTANYWDVYWRLPRETRGYVPMFIATAYILSNPDVFALVPVGEPTPLAYEETPVMGMFSLQEIARMAGAEYPDVRDLNSELVRPSLPPARSAYRLKLPVGTAETFLAAYDALPNDRKKPSNEYIVRSGDNLGAIAQRFGVSVGTLMQQNGLRSTLIHPGDRLVVPILATESASLASIDSVGTIRRISYSYTPLAQIALPPYEAADGTIPIRFVADADVVDEDGAVVQRVSPAPPTRVTYTVRSGDSLSTIARRYGVSVSDLRRWNNLRGSLIRTGQRLTIMLRQT